MAVTMPLKKALEKLAPGPQAVGIRRQWNGLFCDSQWLTDRSQIFAKSRREALQSVLR